MIERKTFDGQIYYSRPATNGAMCDVGEITSVFVYEHEFNSDDNTCRIYCTDGWAVRMVEVKRFNKNDFEKVAEQYLNTQY